MAFAIIETGGKQYRVTPGAELKVEKLDSAAGKTISFDRVLLYQDGNDSRLGLPLVEGVTVTAEVLSQEKGPKIRVFTYKPKKRQHCTLGHRQQVTRLRITEVGLTKATASSKEGAAKPKAATKKPAVSAKE